MVGRCWEAPYSWSSMSSTYFFEQRGKWEAFMVFVEGFHIVQMALVYSWFVCLFGCLDIKSPLKNSLQNWRRNPGSTCSSGYTTVVGDLLRSDPQDGYDFETLKNSHGFCMFFGPVVDSYMFFNVNNPVFGGDDPSWRSCFFSDGVGWNPPASFKKKSPAYIFTKKN